MPNKTYRARFVGYSWSCANCHQWYAEKSDAEACEARHLQAYRKCRIEQIPGEIEELEQEIAELRAERDRLLVEMDMERDGVI